MDPNDSAVRRSRGYGVIYLTSVWSTDTQVRPVRVGRGAVHSGSVLWFLRDKKNFVLRPLATAPPFEWKNTSFRCFFWLSCVM